MVYVLYWLEPSLILENVSHSERGYKMCFMIDKKSIPYRYIFLKINLSHIHNVDNEKKSQKEDKCCCCQASQA